MITYVTGDLLQSEAQCLVNAVNCEGHMGKGIAYQFKFAFPENNVSYEKACQDGSLHIGTLHHFREKGKIIVNFPTKDKWRDPSKVQYIEIGLDQLLLLIEELDICSIAIPPLGSGNGGLIWAEVKQLIERKLTPLAIDKKLDIFIYEPAKNYAARPTAEPRLSTSALVLMQIKLHLRKFSHLRLQKTAYLMDVFGKQHYFSFKKRKHGPYDYAIEATSKRIREFQQYHSVDSTAEAYEIAYRKLVSKSVDSQISRLSPHIERASNYVNEIDQDSRLECLTTLLFLIETNGPLPENELMKSFQSWSEDQTKRFSEAAILHEIAHLLDTGVIGNSLMGYSIL